MKIIAMIQSDNYQVGPDHMHHALRHHRSDHHWSLADCRFGDFGLAVEIATKTVLIYIYPFTPSQYSNLPQGPSFSSASTAGSTTRLIDQIRM